MKRLTALLSAFVLLALTLVPALADGESYNAYYIIPDSDTRRLTESELWSYTRETLRFIRNELLARHGYAFTMDKFYDYFNAKPWYTAGGYGTSRVLTGVEWDNISTVKRVERAMDQQNTQNSRGIDITSIIAFQNTQGGYGNQISYGNARGGGSGLTVSEAGGSGSGSSSNNRPPKAVTPQPYYIYTTQYIIPDSDVRSLTEGELWAYTRETLRYIRNEILARHGYNFGSNKFAQYFNAKSWYSAGGYENATLSSVEWNNIDRIKKVERAMDALGTENSGQLDITTIRQNQAIGACPGGQ